MSEITVVTGANSGIGKALSIALAARGKKVLAVARNVELLRQLKIYNPLLIDTISADIGTYAGRKTVFSHIPKGTKLLALVNNAATMSPTGYLCAIKMKEWRKQISINLEAPLFLTNKLLHFLHNGRILNITTYNSFKVTVGLGSYGISKAALNMVTEYFRIELKKYNIAVGSVLPGIVDTGIQKQLPNTEDIRLRDGINNLQRSKKLLAPEIVAGFLAWLLLDTTDKQFTTKTWDIYDAEHHKYWALNFKVPGKNIFGDLEYEI